MASTNQKLAFFLNILVILSLVIFVSAAESRILGATGFLKARTPQCTEVFGVRSGDTCFGLTKGFNLTPEFFNSINPNLNCDALFVGQWLCIDGSA